MSDAVMWGALAIAAANIILTITLVVLYGRIYAKTRAPFTLGLLLFAAAFLVQNGLVVYSYGMMMSLIPDAVAPYLLGIGLLEALGLAAVIWTASR